MRPVPTTADEPETESVPHDTPPRPAESPPSLALFLSEPGRSALDLATMSLASPLLRRAPRGDGHGVLVLPGLGATDSSTLVLRRFLRRLGYQAWGWRLGRNVGPTSKVVDGMQASLDLLVERSGGPVSVIGWSLGGIFARELSRREESPVRQVITLGSPFAMMAADRTRADRMYRRREHLHVAESRRADRSEIARPVPVPSTAVYSRRDGIVSWRTCVQQTGPQSENIEVRCSHLGFGHDPATLWAVADRLAQPADGWRPFRVPARLRLLYPAPTRPARGPERRFLGWGVTLFDPASSGRSGSGPDTRTGDDSSGSGTGVAGNSGPLAARMRPRTLDEVVGQDHLLAQGSPLRRLVEGDSPMSLILYGPPGTGKTTLALIVSSATSRRFEQLSALNAGVKDVREVIARARSELTHLGRQTVLFIDEIHRFSKTQQDSLLAAVEARHVTLVAATTENPFFSIVSPLLSRSLLLTLQPLEERAVGALVDRALISPRGLNHEVTLDADARAHLLRLSGGDARRALTALEAAAGTVLAEGRGAVDLATLEQAVDSAAVRYDRDGDQHYDVISAFIKSIRGSDVDAAVHYLARMLEAGEDPRFIARRLVVHASEDIGLADPSALLAATAAAQAVQLIGLPEARINLAQATIHLALAPKSNAVVRAIDEAQADVRAGQAGAVPPALRDGHYPGAAKLGAGARYVYPPDTPEGVVEQQYPPDELIGRDYYRPAGRGARRRPERLERLRAHVRGRKRT